MLEHNANPSSASPSTSLPVINNRLDLADFILRDQELKEGLVDLLRRSSDSKRIIQRFSLGRGDADDLIALCKTIRVTEEIASMLSQRQEAQKTSEQTAGDAASTSGSTSSRSCIDDILSRFSLDAPLDLADRIAAAIDEEGVSQLHYIEDAESAAVAVLAQDVESSQPAESCSQKDPETAHRSMYLG